MIDCPLGKYITRANTEANEMIIAGALPTSDCWMPRWGLVGQGADFYQWKVRGSRSVRRLSAGGCLNVRASLLLLEHSFVLITSTLYFHVPAPQPSTTSNHYAAQYPICRRFLRCTHTDVRSQHRRVTF